METEKDLEKKVINITMKIHNEYPELSKYLEEMPDNISVDDTDEINLTNVKEYYNSLVELIVKYSKTHESTK